MILANTGGVSFGPEATTINALSQMKKVGCGVSELSISLETQEQEVRESCTGARNLLASWVTGTDGKINLKMSAFSADVLADALFGVKTAVTTASVVDELTVGALVNGDVVYTKKPNISVVSIMDSNGTPVTLVAGTDYVISDASFGKIEFLDVSGLTQPFKIDYTHADYTLIKMLQVSGLVRSMSFDGVSSADGTKTRVTFPRVKFSPTKAFNLISEEATELELEGKLLYSDIWAADPSLGGMGKLEIIA
jgi:hypothetical protein